MQLQLYGKKIWLYRSAVDFRSSIDGLSHLVINDMKHSPKDGIFLFFNRAQDKIKCLSWHKNGFVLLYKRIEVGRFYLKCNKSTGAIEIGADEFAWLLAGLDWQTMKNWGELSYEKFS